ncbi:MAG TPA: glycosyltransferase [Micromonosporaceae bacterium]
MPGREKILIFTIPNQGHLNILKRLIRTYRTEHLFRLVLVDRHHSAPDLGDLADLTVTLNGAQRFLNTPASRVFHRVYELLDECIAAARDFDPDLIIYDFCAVEGHFTARCTGVPCWSSIPGFMGPLTDRDYLDACLSSPTNRRAINAIEHRYGIGVPRYEVEVISNSLHIPAELNLLWSYPAVTPANFLTGRKAARYRFTGYLSDGHSRPARRLGKPLIYLSFGTEVMDNLWHGDPITREGVRKCVSALAELWQPGYAEVVFPTLGRTVLPSYPPNWSVPEYVDQQWALSKADVFVTHGGSNSFHEALLSRVPMVVTPFFGDQPSVAERVEQLGVGVNLNAGAQVDRTSPRQFLDRNYIEAIAGAVDRLLTDDTYRESLDGLRLDALPALTELEPLPSLAR